jgi:hypothetical protein
MAKYKHLPIYASTYELLQMVSLKTKTFPKDFKYTLGEKIRAEVIDLVVFIYKANSSSDKQEHLSMILERIQVVELLIRLSHDLRILNVKGYSDIVEITDSIARQATGWSNSQKNSRGQNVMRQGV